MSPLAETRLILSVNGQAAAIDSPPLTRLSKVLREELHLTATKVGCDAGDCGACTVLLGGRPVCACLVAVGQVGEQEVVTLEGLREGSAEFRRLQDSFLRHGAAQCGICTPGMLVSAAALLRSTPEPSEQEVRDALGGVLCRCTGYRKIIAAVRDAGPGTRAPAGESSGEVGRRAVRLDGERKVSGRELFGGDDWPEGSLLLRVVRSPFPHAAFEFGELEAFKRSCPGIRAVFTAKDVPGINCFGVHPRFRDQPVFAEKESRFRGEAVAAVVGRPSAIAELDLTRFPVRWTELPGLVSVEQALAPGAPRIHPERPENILVRGRVVCGDVDRALAAADVVVEAEFETGFVEHACIEPEAGFARRSGSRIELQACTQSPYMDREGIAAILGIPDRDVRIVPTAVGGGFGTKLDLSVQPFLAVAAWLLDEPVRMAYSRAESMQSTTKRHPSRIRCKAGATADGKLLAMDLAGDFNTGAYASWGPTVAARVPIHASGPYELPHYRALTRAVHTHLVPAGAFRGFGVPQGTIAQEQLYDELAEKLGIDRLEFRLRNALRVGSPTVTGQLLKDGVGIHACLAALRNRWQAAHLEAAEFNSRGQSGLRRGVGVAAMWYGCGNTSLANPSTMRIGLKADGRVALHQGAVDIGQGSATVVTQICAQALGAPLDQFDLLSGDTDLTPDCGKTSASRQTFVSGRAALMAGSGLRRAILALAKAGDQAELRFAPGALTVVEKGVARQLLLGSLPLDSGGYVLSFEATFDPPTGPLDADGQGVPYAVYGFGAQLAEVEVDPELGTVKLVKLTAAHDVGRAINPTLVEGQIEGGAAQGVGMALLEEFFPGKGENLHDYLIPTFGEMPEVDSILIEEPSAIGPFGAKGIGEQALIPTTPAILNALYDAVGVRVRKLPATPDRVRAAIRAREQGGGKSHG